MCLDNNSQSKNRDELLALLLIIARQYRALARRYRKLTFRYKSLVDHLSALEERGSNVELGAMQALSKAEEFLAEMEEQFAARGIAMPDDLRAIKAIKPARKESEEDRIRQMQDRFARSTGALSLKVTARADGLFDVRIDEGQQFTLPPTLADILTILSIDTRQSEDAFVGFKTLEEVAILLEKKTGRRFSKRAVTQNIFRLRKDLLDRGGVNPRLIQTNRSKGVRLLLRRKPPVVIESDQP